MESLKIIVGIDPGINGGIALMDLEHVQVFKCPTMVNEGKKEYDLKEMVRVIESFMGYPNELTAYIETVHAMPKQGVVSMFSFGKGYGYWIGMFAALKIPVNYVRPQEWKKFYNLGSDKLEAIERAKYIYPSVNLKPGKMKNDHDGMAEALLIARYGMLRGLK